MNRQEVGYDPQDWPREVNEALAPLDDQHRLFAIAYCTVARLNKRRAAQLAGYAPGSAPNQRQQGYRLSTNVDIRRAIDTILAARALSAKDVLSRLEQHATCSIDDVLDESGRFCIEQARESGAIDLVKKVKTTTTVRRDEDGNLEEVIKVEAEMVDPQAALDKLARAHGLYKDGLSLGDRKAKITIQIGGKEEGDA